MSISNALQTGVSGLSANSSRTSQISSNIANANTVGFRRTFSDFVTQNTTDTQAGVRAVERAEIDSNGTLLATGRLSDFAISGEGFFVVSRQPNDPIKSNYFLTRAGSFQPDNEGNLVNSAGYFLSGFQTDAQGEVGAVDRNSVASLNTVNVGQFQTPGTPTSRVDIAANLPAQVTGLATPGDPFVSTMRYVNQLGGGDELSLSWQPTATANTWSITVTGADGTDYGTASMSFTDSGALAGAPAAYTAGTLPIDPATGVATIQIANGTTPQTIELNFGEPGGFTGLTQFSGDYSAPDFRQDGSETGSLVRAEMGMGGVLYGLFDNGQRRALFEVPLAQVASPNLMRSVDGNAYSPTIQSGALRLAEAGTTAGTIEGGALESSNVDIAQELTDLIQTQRAYSSNAKIVTTSDEMLDETLRIKR
ncbi:flagellar hook protein FlgE [Palleronia salina]|uniref:Flagellar hook protein FlgE n=1 Tax=Palleronia salina TaxID=313368 RepID=A0A1M6CZY3_9RHOB|nr:flagellar hook protein FlgE [Palleronia salina]SHI66384.1 flagellar hook protein FlgE [Palleronia salina]